MRDPFLKHKHPGKGDGNRPSPRSARNKGNAPARHPGNRENPRAQTPGDEKHETKGTDLYI